VASSTRQKVDVCWPRNEKMRFLIISIVIEK